MRFSEYRAMDATAMVAGVRNGDFTALELASAATDRMRAVNDRINAVVLDLTEPGIQQIRDGLPQGPLAGLPFLVKDMDGTLAGHPCSMGSKSLRDWVPDHDSNLFARYRAAGVVFLGKTNCPEFGLLGHTEPDLWGPARNPWNLNHTPGGSSGGAGAAVAAGIVPVAHGGDGGGSIRIPASFNGLFGLKPSRGRMPLGPDVGEGWNGFVVPHVITRSVRDSALFLATSHGPDEGAPYGEPPGSTRFVAATQRRPSRLRIAVSRAAFLTDPIHPDCLAAVDDAVALLTDLGHTVEEITLELDQHALTTAYFTVCAAGAAVDIATTEQRTGRKPTRDRFERTTWLMGKIGRVFSAADLETARVTIDRARRSVAHQLAGFDAHLSPTTAFPASEIGAQDQSRLEQIGMDTIRRVSSVTGPLIDPVYLTLLDQIGSKLLERISNPMLFNMTGQPAMSVPLWWNDRGLPVGVQFAAGYGHEALLLGLAAQLEEARPWFDRIPPL